MTRIAIVHLGRSGALGESRRIASWRSIFEEMGADVTECPLRVEHRSVLDLPSVGGVAGGRLAPETLAWSTRSLVRSLESIRPDGVVCVTTRAFDSRVGRRWPTIVDFVDLLSESYRDRAEESGLVRRLGWRLLSHLHARTERLIDHRPTTAAGLGDAQALGATWVPNVLTVPAARVAPPDHDIVFFGNLAYGPNRQSLRRLARITDLIREERPATTVLIGGANTDTWVETLADRAGWTLHGPFDDVTDFVRRGRVAVAPLDHVAGIQNKVLEAAAAGVPQVISTAAAHGLPPAPPVRIAADDETFARAVIEAIDEDPIEDAAARRWIDQHFTPARWVDTVTGLLERAGPG